MDTEKDTQATEGDAADDTEGQWNPVHSAVPADDKGDADTEGHWNPIHMAVPADETDDTEGHTRSFHP